MSFSRSYSFSTPSLSSSPQPATPSASINYPIEGLNLSRFNGERARLSLASPLSSTASPIRIPPATSPVTLQHTDEYDLSSESGESSDGASFSAGGPPEEEEDVYDLFAVREVLLPTTRSGGVKYRAFAKDPTATEGVWAAFDPGCAVGREIGADLKDLVTPNTDLLFYRRRD